MTTPIWITGFEHGVISANGGGLFSSLTTNPPSIETSIVRTGSYSLKVQTNGTAGISARRNLSASAQVGIVRAYFYLPTGGVPDASTSVLGFQITTVAQTGGFNITAAGECRALVGGGSPTSPVSFSLDTWHKIDLFLDIRASTWTLDWYLDDVAQTQATWAGQATNDSINYLRMGSASSTVTYTGYYDDIVLSETVADFPIPDGATKIILPTSDGTHNAGTNVIEDNAGADIGAVTAYDLIDDVPMSTATTYIRQAANGTGNYAEILFGDITDGGLLIGANAILAYTSATTSTDSGATIVSHDDFSSFTEVWGNPTTPLDMSDGSTSNVFYKSAMITGGDNRTNVNNLKARVGYSGDANPDPYWINLGVEVAYFSENKSNLSKTLDNMTMSAAGTVAGAGATEGTLSKTLDNMTSSAAGTVDVAGSLAKTLDDMTLSSAGDVDIVGSLSKTLGDMTLVSSGTVDINSSLSKTLDDMTLGSAGTVETHGSLSKTLDDMTSTSSGTVETHGSLSKTLDDMSLVSLGLVDVVGSSNKTLDDMTLGASATVDLNGSLDKTLDDMTLTASGGAGEATGVLETTLDNMTSSSSGTVDIVGSLSKTLEDMVAIASGAVDIIGSSAMTLEDMTSSASGTAGTSGDLNVVLGDMVAVANGTVEIKAILTNTLEDMIAAASGNVDVIASLEKVLDAMTSTSSGTVLINASLLKTLEDMSVSADGQLGAPTTGILNKTLEDMTLSSSGQTEIAASLGLTLESMISSGSGEIEVRGNLEKAFDNMTVLANGAVDINGSLIKSLEDMFASSNATVIVSGQLDTQLESMGMTASAFVGAGITAVLVSTLDDMTMGAQGDTNSPQPLSFNTIAFLSTTIEERTTLVTDKKDNILLTDEFNSSTLIS